MEIAIKIVLTLSLAYSAFKYGYHKGRSDELKHWCEWMERLQKS